MSQVKRVSAGTAEPSYFVAGLDIRLQGLAQSLRLRKEYYDLREYARARLERHDLGASRTLNALFIHIPKCGGTTVENQMRVFHGHRSAVYFRALDGGFFQGAFKFSLVRNPYDRLVSGFHYLKHHTRSELNHEWVAQNIGRFATFGDFAEALEDPRFSSRITAWKHFVPQWYFLCDRRRRLLVDHVGRIEAFDAFITDLARRTPIRLRNEVHRPSERKPWQDYYSDRSRRAVAAIYREDFRLFGYPD